jgi:hypothetical protein
MPLVAVIFPRLTVIWTQVDLAFCEFTFANVLPPFIERKTSRESVPS